jgi:hypothetical protein
VATTHDESEWLLEFDIGRWKPWSVNELTNSRQGHAIRSKQKRWWRDAGEAAGMTIAGRPLPPCTVQVAIPFRTNQRRDPHNYVGTVVKAIVDGLVRAGVWPDDNPDWVTVLEPICYVGSVVQIKITTRSNDESQP